MGYQKMERFRTPEIKEAAIKGGEFLMKFGKMSDSGKCYFSVTREGSPVKVQRTIFAEVFYVMAMTSLHSITGDKKYQEEACTMMSKILWWAGAGAAELGRPELEGAGNVSSLAVPMCILSLLPMVEEVGWTRAGLREKCIEEILLHFDRDKGMVLENVTPEGRLLDGVAGRLLNPGHAIECGWFLLDLANKKGDDALKKTAIDEFIEKPLNYGWDKEFGGIFYFLDSEGFSPTALEWDMKLWWVHLEAMVATLMAFQTSKQDKHWTSFLRILNYSFDKFPLNGGEWAGYLNREGKVKMDFKGGPYKGCFHLPRALMICETILRTLK